MIFHAIKLKSKKYIITIFHMHDMIFVSHIHTHTPHFRKNLPFHTNIKPEKNHQPKKTQRHDMR